MLEYINSGKITVSKEFHKLKATYHDPCNYGRKSEKAFGHGYYEEGREITKACCEQYEDMTPNREFNYCCGAGGGAWALPYNAERIFYGRVKARQIEDTGADLVIAPCHNCRDQLLKSLNKEFDLNVEIKYLWELVADSLVLPGQEAEVQQELNDQSSNI